jgi:hypothetical protein
MAHRHAPFMPLSEKHADNIENLRDCLWLHWPSQASTAPEPTSDQKTTYDRAFGQIH